MNPRAWLVLSLLAAGITWIYATKVQQPWERYIDVDSGKLKAQMGDLYPRWVGTRALLLHGRNPYGPEVSREIQIGFYGHPIEQSYKQGGSDLVDEQRFVYPVYVVFLLAPTVYLDFFTAQLLARIIFALLTAASVWAGMRILRWHPPKTLQIAIVLIILSSPQIVQGLRLCQLGMLVAALLVLSAWCVAKERLALGGAFLAIATIKPQMVVIPLLWFAVWGLSNLRSRWPLLAGFGVTLAGLAGLGCLILPGWPGYFIDGLIAYRHYFPTESLLQLALGKWAGGAISIVIVCGLLVLAWKNRATESSSVQFQQVLAAFFVGNSLLTPAFQPFNQVLLILPVLLAIRGWTALSRVGRVLFGLAVAWPPVTSLVLLFVHPRLDSPGRLPLLPSVLALYVPFLVFLLLAKRLSGTRPRQLSCEVVA